MSRARAFNLKLELERAYILPNINVLTHILVKKARLSFGKLSSIELKLVLFTLSLESGSDPPLARALVKKAWVISSF